MWMSIAIVKTRNHFRKEDKCYGKNYICQSAKALQARAG